MQSISRVGAALAMLAAAASAGATAIGNFGRHHVDLNREDNRRFYPIEATGSRAQRRARYNQLVRRSLSGNKLARKARLGKVGLAVLR